MFFWADHYTFLAIVLDSCFLCFICFCSCRRRRHVHHFSFFFATSLHVFFLFGENAINYTPDEYGNICFLFSFTFCFKLSNQRAINEIQLCTLNTVWHRQLFFYLLLFVQANFFIHIFRPMRVMECKGFGVITKKNVLSSQFSVSNAQIFFGRKNPTGISIEIR